jgi:hypothetical protein
VCDVFIFVDILCTGCVSRDIFLPGERICDCKMTYVCLQSLELDSWNLESVIEDRRDIKTIIVYLKIIQTIWKYRF